MGAPAELRTPRLVLRRWLDADRLPFAVLNRDPLVMEHYPATLTRAESDALVDRIEDQFHRQGWGLWAVELVESHELIGYVGLWRVAFTAHFTPAVEVAWRLSHAHWGQGFAPEAAGAAIDDAFTRLDLDEIVSFTSTANARSRRVMEKLGMRHDPRDDFDHPSLADGHPLRRHVLYRLARSMRRGEDLDTLGRIR